MLWSDMTLLYYTANVIPESFADRVRGHLFEMANGLPIVSVSQKPIDFGENICMENIGHSPPSVYRQILTGAKIVKTKYLACCEDDSLHDQEYFSDTKLDTDHIYYNHRWNVMPTFFYFRRKRYGMCTCVCSTELMVKIMQEKWDRWEKEKYQPVFAEPGRRDKELGLYEVKLAFLRTKNVSLTFKHWNSLSGVSKIFKSDIVYPIHPFWGKATDLWKRFKD
jgi:hypothetical protein